MIPTSTNKPRNTLFAVSFVHVALLVVWILAPKRLHQVMTISLLACAEPLGTYLARVAVICDSRIDDLDDAAG